MKRKNRYGAVKTKICKNCFTNLNVSAKFCHECEGMDLVTLDSKLEARYYLKFSRMQAKDDIRDLDVHKRVPLNVNGCRVAYYIPDFTFDYLEDGIWKYIIIDVKGGRDKKFIDTPVSALKRRILYAITGYPVLIATHEGLSKPGIGAFEQHKKLAGFPVQPKTAKKRGEKSGTF